MLFFHHFHLKIWLLWHLAQQGKVQVVIKLRNWKQYEAGLIQRGSISFWINDDAIDQWNPEAKDKTRGRQEEYSDLAIQICLTFRLLYRQALRQTEGFINSLLKLMDLDLICPDHTTLSRRSQTLKELQEQQRCCTKIFWNRFPHFSCFLPNSYGI